ncbi:hypothetical protein NECAME_01681 [Necator americanus]|uniref:Uncharacterized protein n=1 Tax=Necator americanus TaxID=51031 RepID=W2TQ26_NECAM|nr:hypothetical protein NECAME_01681 [Necator americanus]ETN83888.1 hypothetical protein NECAME_01681 [Necator americanus]
MPCQKGRGKADYKTKTILPIPSATGTCTGIVNDATHDERTDYRPHTRRRTPMRACVTIGAHPAPIRPMILRA